MTPETSKCNRTFQTAHDALALLAVAQTALDGVTRLGISESASTHIRLTKQAEQAIGCALEAIKELELP